MKVKLGDVKRLKLIATNPSSKSSKWDLEWRLDDKIGAWWRGITIDAGKTIELLFDVIFGSYLPGDANLDSKINLADVLVVQSIMLGTGIPNKPSDANQDGKINQVDVITIKKIMKGTLPIPTPVEFGKKITCNSILRMVEVSTQKEWLRPLEPITIEFPDLPEPEVSLLWSKSSPYVVGSTLDCKIKIVNTSTVARTLECWLLTNGIEPPASRTKQYHAVPVTIGPGGTSTVTLPVYFGTPGIYNVQTKVAVDGYEFMYNFDSIDVTTAVFPIVKVQWS